MGLVYDVVLLRKKDMDSLGLQFACIYHISNEKQGRNLGWSEREDLWKKTTGPTDSIIDQYERWMKMHYNTCGYGGVGAGVPFFKDMQGPCKRSWYVMYISLASFNCASLLTSWLIMDIEKTCTISSHHSTDSNATFLRFPTSPLPALPSPSLSLSSDLLYHPLFLLSREASSLQTQATS